MRAMILAAGRGQRMRPLTDHTPKPLLSVGGTRLIDYHLQKLAAVGVTEVVINCAHLAEQFPSLLGSEKRFGLKIHYSFEPEGGLETAGGIAQALSLLGDEPFWVINGDIWTDLPFSDLPHKLAGDDLACLVMVANPEHHPGGDFAISAGRIVLAKQQTNAMATYAGIGLFSPKMFCRDDLQIETSTGFAPFYKLRPLLEEALRQNRLAAHYWAGAWYDIGTPERLAQLDTELRSQSQ